VKSKKEKYVSDPEANTNMMNCHGTLEKVPYLKLVEVFGEPTSHGWCEKVQYEWVFTGPNGSIVTLYDWMSIDASPSTWLVASLKPAYAQDFIKWLNKKISK